MCACVWFSVNPFLTAMDTEFLLEIGFLFLINGWAKHHKCLRFGPWCKGGGTIPFIPPLISASRFSTNHFFKDPFTHAISWNISDSDFRGLLQVLLYWRIGIVQNRFCIHFSNCVSVNPTETNHNHPIQTFTSVLKIDLTWMWTKFIIALCGQNTKIFPKAHPLLWYFGPKTAQPQQKLGHNMFATIRHSISFYGTNITVLFTVQLFDWENDDFLVLFETDTGILQCQMWLLKPTSILVINLDILVFLKMKRYFVHLDAWIGFNSSVMGRMADSQANDLGSILGQVFQLVSFFLFNLSN